MKLNKKAHKQLLFHLFFDEEKVRDGFTLRPKTFGIDKLSDAGSAAKKLKVDVEGKPVFDDTEVEFSVGEAAILKGLFDEHAKKGFAFGDADSVKEIKEIFEGKNVVDDKEQSGLAEPAAADVVK